MAESSDQDQGPRTVAVESSHPIPQVPGKISREMQMRTQMLTIVQLILERGLLRSVAKEMHNYLICIPSIWIWILDCPVSSFLKRTYKDIKKIGLPSAVCSHCNEFRARYSLRDSDPFPATVPAPWPLSHVLCPMSSVPYPCPLQWPVAFGQQLP